MGISKITTRVLLWLCSFPALKRINFCMLNAECGPKTSNTTNETGSVLTTLSSISWIRRLPTRLPTETKCNATLINKRKKKNLSSDQVKRSKNQDREEALLLARSNKSFCQCLKRHLSQSIKNKAIFTARNLDPRKYVIYMCEICKLTYLCWGSNLLVTRQILYQCKIYIRICSEKNKKNFQNLNFKKPKNLKLIKKNNVKKF